MSTLIVRFVRQVAPIALDIVQIASRRVSGNKGQKPVLSGQRRNCIERRRIHTKCARGNASPINRRAYLWADQHSAMDAGCTAVALCSAQRRRPQGLVEQHRSGSEAQFTYNATGPAMRSKGDQRLQRCWVDDCSH